MRTHHAGMVLVALVLVTGVVAQEPDKPQLTARQVAASRALREMTRPLMPTERPNLLVEPMDRSIYIDTGVIFDPRRPATFAEQIKEASCAAVAVLSGTVEDHTAFLNEDASFILTEYVIHVDSILRGKAEGLPNVSYVRPGGTMNVGGRVVTTRHNLYPPLVRGQTYVVFVSRIGSGGQFMPTISTIDTLQGGDGTLKALGPMAESQLARGLESSFVRREIGTVSCRGQD